MKKILFSVGFSTETGMKCSFCKSENLKHAALRLRIVGIPEKRGRYRIFYLCQKCLGISSIVWIPNIISAYEGFFDLDTAPNREDRWGLK